MADMVYLEARRTVERSGRTPGNTRQWKPL
jgi:hypothetical protein